MKHVIYYTEFYSGNGTFLRDEENDAYFNTLPEDPSGFPRKNPANWMPIVAAQTRTKQINQGTMGAPLC